MITLKETGWLCTEEAYEDVKRMFDIDLHTVKKGEFHMIIKTDGTDEPSVKYTLSTCNGKIEITAVIGGK